MKLFALTRKAKTDLQAIAVFTEERWGIVQRNTYIKQFDDAFHTLAASPLLGVGCDAEGHVTGESMGDGLREVQ